MQEMKETWVRSPGQEDPLEEGMATHSSVLVCRIPWTEEACWATVRGVAESDTTEHTRSWFGVWFPAPTWLLPNFLPIAVDHRFPF